MEIIDFPNLLAGALIGWCLNRLSVWSRRVQVNFHGFVKVPVNFGVLYKLVFSLRGHTDPGECTCEIETAQGAIFAKWDEAPNPLKDDRLDSFVPELVPHTFHQKLYIGRRYSVPIIIDDNSKFYMFDAWWFGKSKGYYRFFPINESDELAIKLRGTNFVWQNRWYLRQVTDAQKIEK